MSWPLDPRLDLPINREVVEWLRRAQPSAHSDIASVLTDAMRGLPGAYASCPDLHAYAWVAACTPAHGIFGLAFGQSGLALRLGPDARASALAAGARELPEIGGDWVTVPADAAFPLRRWCQLAFTHVAALEARTRPAAP